MLSAVRCGLGVLVEGGTEEDLSGSFVERVSADEVAGEVVVFAVGDDELDFVVLGEGFEVFEPEGVGGAACTGAFDVDDLVDGFGDFGQWAFTAGLDHQGVVLGEKAIHQGEEFAGLQHGSPPVNSTSLHGARASICARSRLG